MGEIDRLVKICRFGELVSSNGSGVKIYHLREGYLSLLEGADKYRQVAGVNGKKLWIDATGLKNPTLVQLMDIIHNLLCIGGNTGLMSVREEDGKLRLIETPSNMLRYDLSLNKRFKEAFELGIALTNAEDLGAGECEKYIFVIFERTCLIYKKREGVVSVVLFTTIANLLEALLEYVPKSEWQSELIDKCSNKGLYMNAERVREPYRSMIRKFLLVNAL